MTMTKPIAMLLLFGALGACGETADDDPPGSSAGSAGATGSGTGRACKVNGEVYPSGSSGFAGPLECNLCGCDDGALTCTREACESACPPNSVPGSRCAQCGPSGGCDVVEYTCLVLCADVCDDGSCVDGVCQRLCR